MIIAFKGIDNREDSSNREFVGNFVFVYVSWANDDVREIHVLMDLVDGVWVNLSFSTEASMFTVFGSTLTLKRGVFGQKVACKNDH